MFFHYGVDCVDELVPVSVVDVVLLEVVDDPLAPFVVSESLELEAFRAPPDTVSDVVVEVDGGIAGVVVVVLVASDVVLVVETGVAALVETGVVALVETGVVALVETGVVALVETGVVALVETGVVALVEPESVVPAAPVVVVVEVVAVVLVEPDEVAPVELDAVTTPLLKSCSFEISIFIGSIESEGSLQFTVFVIPILVAVTSAEAPSGLLGCTFDCKIVTHIFACTFKPLMLLIASDPSGCSTTSNDTNLSRLSWSTSLLSNVLTNLSARFN
jgi:hypothetical protein